MMLLHCFFSLSALLPSLGMMSASALPADVASSNNNKVIIIGGGLAGLSLSLGLANLGFQVDIVEKQPNFSRTGATFGVAANGQKALEELCPGVVNDLKKVGLDIDPPDIGILLGWWNVRDALLEQVMKKKNVIHIRNGWLLQDIKDDDTCVKAVFHKQQQGNDDDEDRDEQLVLEGCMLVGADGVNSAVRSLLGLPSAKNTGVVTWRVRVQVPPLREEQDAETCNETHGKEQEAMLSALRPFVESPLKVPLGRIRGPLIYMLCNFSEKLPGTMALVVTIQQGDGEETAKDTSPQVMMEANAESDDERREIQAILEFTDRDGLHSPTLIKVVEPPKEVGAGWGGKGRITILGDAAHAMRPERGQGGSMAFEDSVMLCRALAKAKAQGTLDDKAGVQRALGEFENSRIPRVRKIWVEQWERAEMAYKQPKQMEPWSDEYRAWVYDGV